MDNDFTVVRLMDEAQHRLRYLIKVVTRRMDDMEDDELATAIDAIGAANDTRRRLTQYVTAAARDRDTDTKVEASS